MTTSYGASPEHPMVLGAYGEGPRPVLSSSIRLWSTHHNVAIRDLHIRSADRTLDVLGSIDHLYIENVVTELSESRIQGSEESMHRSVTLRRCMILDVHREAPVVGQPKGGQAAYGPRVDLGALVEQQLHDLHMTRIGSQVQGGQSAVASRIHVGPLV